MYRGLHNIHIYYRVIKGGPRLRTEQEANLGVDVFGWVFCFVVALFVHY